MGAGGSKYELTPAVVEGLLREYHTIGGISVKTHIAGWTDAELTWLLVAFSSRCTQLNEIQEEKEEDTADNRLKGSRKHSLKREKKDKEKEKDKHKFSIVSLSNLVLKKTAALKYIVVFNQSFVNYPSLSDRFWSLLDCTGIDYCNFLEYANLMYKVVRGSWEDRATIAFNLFDTDKNGSITIDEVVTTVTEISEFICNVARGLLTMNEFNSLKLSQVHNLFAGTNGDLTKEQFLQVAEFHRSLFGCSEILDMVFGRVIRKMEMDMHRDCVFGRHLQETALGNVKDITGDMPFVPEVIASAIHYLREHNALGTPELFRISVAKSVLNHVKDELNKGYTLRCYLKQIKKPGEDEFMLLASLIKTFCHELQEPAFEEETSRKIIAVEESSIDPPKKLEYFQKVFYNLPTPNRYFLGTLFRFLKEVSDAQIAQGAKGCMSSSNLGVVFAPCTLYSPNDPTVGATSAPVAFQRFIDNCQLFDPANTPNRPTSLNEPAQSVTHLQHEISNLRIQVEKLKTNQKSPRKRISPRGPPPPQKSPRASTEPFPSPRNTEAQLPRSPRELPKPPAFMMAHNQFPSAPPRKR